jgi:hypothetical protein
VGWTLVSLGAGGIAGLGAFWTRRLRFGRIF